MKLFGTLLVIQFAMQMIMLGQFANAATQIGDPIKLAEGSASGQCSISDMHALQVKARQVATDVALDVCHSDQAVPVTDFLVDMDIDQPQQGQCRVRAVGAFQCHDLTEFEKCMAGCHLGRIPCVYQCS